MLLKKIRNNKEVWFLVLVMLLSLIIRTWRFEDALCFKMDQARDARIARVAFEKGSGYLPLLGPRAAGTFLRLGPIFYYFQYLATLIFQSIEPWVMVVPDLFFSVLSIGLFYFFLCQFFARWNALLTSALYGFSFLSIQYSRFGWNPNSIPFWGLLFLFAVYKTAVIKNQNKAGKWLLLVAVSYGVLSQLHYTALLVFPLVAIIFWFFYRPNRVKKIYWLGAFLLLSFFYIPMFISELHTDFDNWHQFNYALTAKNKDYPFFEKLFQSFDLHGMYYSLILTSYGNKESLVFKIFFVGLTLFFLFQTLCYFKNGKIKRKKALLFLVLIWFFVFSAFYTKMAFTVLKPRFWLMIIFIPYIFLAMFFNWLYRPGHKRRGRVWIGFIAMIFLLSNLYAVSFWYWSVDRQIRDDQLSGFYVRDLVLKQKDLVSLLQIKEVVASMSQRSLETGREICFYTDAEYRVVYEYSMKTYQPQTSMKRISFSSDTNNDCTFFSISKSPNDREIPKLPRKHIDKFEGIKRTDFGVVTLWETRRTDLSYLENEILNQMFTDGRLSQEDYNSVIEKKKKQATEKSKEKEKQQQQNLLELDGLFLEDEELEDDADIELKLEDSIKKPARKERIFWKDAFNWDVKY